MLKLNRQSLYSYFISSVIIIVIYIHAQYGILNTKAIIDRFSEIRDIAVFLTFSNCFLLLYMSKQRYIRTTFLFFTFITFAFFVSYIRIMYCGKIINQELDFELYDANLLLVESSRNGAFKDVLKSFWYHIIIGCIEASVYVYLIYIVIKRLAPRIQRFYFSIIPIILICAIYLLIGTGAAVNKMPIVTKVPMQLWFASRLKVYKGERDNASLPMKMSYRFPMIIYIIDESIRGDMLSINNFTVDTTPFLYRYNGTLLNYGIGISASNCSSGSHIFLQTGILPKKETLINLGTDLFKKPNIFQYAKKAGYHTVYIDGQLKGRGLQNYMRSTDFKYIDEYIQIRDKYNDPLRYEIDMNIADEISNKIAFTSRHTFCYVLKSGAHFPFELSYPDSEKYFTPTSELRTPETKNALINNYKNSIRWNVDKFFERMLNGINKINANVLIIYTSDHGQNLMDDGGIVGHCSSYVHPSEVRVLILLVATKKSRVAINSLAQHYLNENKNRISHFQLFPTLLTVMGYERNAVKMLYGSSLFDSLQSVNERFTIAQLVPGGASSKIVTFQD